jgi:hypothetical protein
MIIQVAAAMTPNDRLINRLIKRKNFRLETVEISIFPYISTHVSMSIEFSSNLHTIFDSQQHRTSFLVIWDPS